MHPGTKPVKPDKRYTSGVWIEVAIQQTLECMELLVVHSWDQICTPEVLPVAFIKTWVIRCSGHPFGTQPAGCNGIASFWAIDSWL